MSKVRRHKSLSSRRTTSGHCIIKYMNVFDLLGKISKQALKESEAGKTKVIENQKELEEDLKELEKCVSS